MGSRYMSSRFHESFIQSPVSIMGGSRGRWGHDTCLVKPLIRRAGGLITQYMTSLKNVHEGG